MPRIALSALLSLTLFSGCTSMKTAHISAEELRARLCPESVQTSPEFQKQLESLEQKTYNEGYFAYDLHHSNHIGSRAFEEDETRPQVELYMWHTFKELWLKQQAPGDYFYNPAQTTLKAEEKIKEYTNFHFGDWKAKINLSTNSIGFTFSRSF